MKKLLCVALALMLVLSLAACGASNTPATTPNTSNRFYLSVIEYEGEITGEDTAIMFLKGREQDRMYNEAYMWSPGQYIARVRCAVTNDTITLWNDVITLTFAKK